VNTREGNQQARIGQGVRSGQLTPRETSHLEGKEAAIHQEVHSDRAANGGHLTGQERAQVNHQQNQVSRDIDRDKHNARTDRPAQEHNEHPHQR
jgi:hypothetical protein